VRYPGRKGRTGSLAPESPGSGPAVKDREPGESAARPRIQRYVNSKSPADFGNRYLAVQSDESLTALTTRKHRRRRSGPSGGPATALACSTASSMRVWNGFALAFVSGFGIDAPERPGTA